MESLTAYTLQEGQLIDFVVSNVAVSFDMIALPRIFSISYLLPVLDLVVDREGMEVGEGGGCCVVQCEHQCSVGCGSVMD